MTDDTETTEKPETEQTEGTGETAAAPAAPEKTFFDLILAACQDCTEEGKKKFRVQAVNEQDATFIVRLLEKTLTIPQPVFDALPDEAQLWAVNLGTEAAEAQKANETLAADKLVPPAGFVSKFKAKEGAEVKSPKEKKVKAVKEPKPPKEKKERVRDENTLGRIIRRALISNQSTTVDAIKTLLEAAGHKDVKAASVSSYRTDTLETLRLAAEMGLFKANPAA